MMTARDPAVHDVLALFEGFRREGFRAWLAGGWAVADEEHANADPPDRSH